MEFRGSLFRKFMIPNVLILGLLLGLLFFLTTSLENESQLLLKRGQTLQTTQLRLFKIRESFSALEHILLSARFKSKNSNLDEIPFFAQKLNEDLSRLEVTVNAPRGKVIVQRLSVNLSDAKSSVRELTEAIESGDQKTISIAFEKWKIRSEWIYSLLADANIFVIKQLMTEFESIRHRRIQFGIALGILVGLFALILGVISYYFYHLFIQPIESMTAAATQMTEAGNPFKVPLENREDEIGHLAHAFNQMTGRLFQSNSKLKETLAARDQFISIASHELKTPLTTLSLQIQILQKMCGQHETTPLSIPKHVLPGLALAEKQADRFNQLINDLLDMSKIRAGKLEYHFKRVSLSSIVHTVTERLTKVLEAEGCPLEIDLDPKIVGYWDQSRIQDVLVNLLMNARKYARGSRVQVTTRFKENRAILTVRDFGPGIPKEMQSRIFERFERATATTDSTRGLGLGLYIAKTVAERHQGTIEVESEVGVGTTFIVKLPLIVRGEPIHWQTEGSLLRSKRRRNAAAKEHRTPSESDAPLAQNSAASAQDSVPPLQDSVNSAQNSVTSTQDLAPPPAL